VQVTKVTIESSLRELADGTEGERWPLFNDQANRWAWSVTPWLHGHVEFIVGEGGVHVGGQLTGLLPEAACALKGRDRVA